MRVGGQLVDWYADLPKIFNFWKHHEIQILASSFSVDGSKTWKKGRHHPKMTVMHCFSVELQPHSPSIALAAAIALQISLGFLPNLPSLSTHFFTCFEWLVPSEEKRELRGHERNSLLLWSGNKLVNLGQSNCWSVNRKIE